MARYQLLLLEALPSTSSVEALAAQLPSCVSREVFDRVRRTGVGSARLGESDDEVAVNAAREQLEAAGCFVCIVDRSTWWHHLLDRLRGLARPGPAARTATVAPSAGPAAPVALQPPTSQEVRRVGHDPARRNAMLTGGAIVLVGVALLVTVFGGEAPRAGVARTIVSHIDRAGSVDETSRDEGVSPGSPNRRVQMQHPQGGHGSAPAASASPRPASAAARAHTRGEPSQRPDHTPHAPTLHHDDASPWPGRALAFGLGLLIAQGLGMLLRRNRPRTAPRAPQRTGALHVGLSALLVMAGLVPVLRSPSEAPASPPEPQRPPPAAPPAPRPEAPRPPFARLLARTATAATPPVEPSPFSRWMAQYRARQPGDAGVAPSTVAVALTEAPAEAPAAPRRHRHTPRHPRHARHAHRNAPDGGTAATATTEPAPSSTTPDTAVRAVASRDAAVDAATVALHIEAPRGAEGPAAPAPGASSEHGAAAGPAEPRPAPAQRDAPGSPDGSRTPLGLAQFLLLGLAAGVLVTPGWRSLRSTQP